MRPSTATGTHRYILDQTRCIVGHTDEQGMRCVIHLGDLLQTSSDIAQCERAKSAIENQIEPD